MRVVSLLISFCSLLLAVDRTFEGIGLVFGDFNWIFLGDGERMEMEDAFSVGG